MSKAVSEFHKKFGKRIKQLREKKHMNQEELAFQIDVDRSYMGFIERGERNPSLSKIKKISDKLGIPLTTLFDF